MRELIRIAWNEKTQVDIIIPNESKVSPSKSKPLILRSLDLISIDRESLLAQ